MSNTVRLGATGFGLWGLLHVAGGAALLIGLRESPAAGFAAYAKTGESYDALAGAILGYFAYGILVAGLVALALAVFGNRRNSETALMANTVMVGAVEIGLVIFLLVPGFVPLLQALPGLLFAALGIVAGGVACRGGPAHEPV